MQKKSLFTWINRLLFILGVIFFVMTYFIALEPTKFLQFSYLGVFVFNLFGPGTLLLPFVVEHFNVLAFALVSALGMSVNDSFVYLIGRSGRSVIPPGKRTVSVHNWIFKRGQLGLFLFSLLPLPYDIIGGTVGYVALPYRYFIVPTFGGKLVRFLVLGLVITRLF